MPVQTGRIMLTFSHFCLVQSTKIFLNPEGTPSQNPGLGALDGKQPSTKSSLSPWLSKSSSPSLAPRLSPSSTQPCWFVVFPNSTPACILAAVRDEACLPEPVSHEARETTAATMVIVATIN